MTNRETTMHIKLDTVGLVTGIKAAKLALGGLDRILSSIGQGLEEAFSVKGITDYRETVSRFGKELADGLLVLQLNFGKLKAAIADAAAPLASLLVPWLNQAVREATAAASLVAQVFRGVIYGITGHDALAASADKAAESEKKLAAAGRAARKSLMSFDQIQRLNAATGSGGTASQPLTPYSPDPISDRAQAIADRILQVLAPLLALDFGPLQQALGHLQSAFATMASVAGQALEWLWFSVITPFLGWVTETFAPAFTETWAAAMTSAALILGPLMGGIENLFTALQPVVAYIGQTVVQALGLWQSAFQALGTVFAVGGPQITGILTNLGVVTSQVWAGIQPVLEFMHRQFSQVFAGITQTVAMTANAILQALYGVSEFLAGAFTANWKQSWEGIRTWFAGLVNGIIALLNGMLSRLGAALNGAVAAANRLSFTVPDWVPGLGGAVFGVNMNPVSVPQIPYLARGAVLPANRPFLAMVGDQRSGTNIEAPLATIQQAVAQVTAEGQAAIAAGLQASVGVQREILQAVLGITIGDEVIGAAADRYYARQTFLTGGAL